MKNESRRSIHTSSALSLDCIQIIIRYTDYASTIAPVGHVPSQAPQSMQVSASMTYWESPWLIASTGQEEAQLPQLMQVSLITRAILKFSFQSLRIAISIKHNRIGLRLAHAKRSNPDTSHRKHLRACLWLVAFIIAAFKCTVKILIGHKTQFFTLYSFISNCRKLYADRFRSSRFSGGADRRACLPQILINCLNYSLYRAPSLLRYSYLAFAFASFSAYILAALAGFAFCRDM